MHDAFIAVGAATDLRAHASTLRQRWDDAFTGSRPAGVRSVVADSWARMLGAGLAPDRLRPTAALDADGLDAAREASPLTHALPTLRGVLGPIADDAEHVMVVCDADGRLLWIEGHQAVLEQAAGIDFVPGMWWTEHSAGTNAIGTALAIDHAVQIFSAEHFLPEQHPWWCSAAPIHDPASGRLLGVVDLSGPQRTAHPHSLGLVMAAAAMAEEALRRRGEQQASAADDGHRVVVPGGRVGDDRAEAPGGAGAGAAARIAVRLLRGPALVDGDREVALGQRQAEVLAVLALHPEGMTADQLTLALYGDDGNPVSTRALVSRLRDQLGPLADAVLRTRPYRLADGLVVDLLEIHRLLAEGRAAEAVAAYPGPLLAGSDVEAVVEAREELDAAVRRTALAATGRAGVEAVWGWMGTPTGRVDLAAVERFLEVADPGDGRRALATSRRRVLLGAWA